MINKRLFVRLVVPLVFLGFIVIGLTYSPFASDRAPLSTPRRSDDLYKQKIISAYPMMQVSDFTVLNVSFPKKSWVIVEIKNTNNGDTLRTLFYDPVNSSSKLLLVSGPSARTDFSKFMDESSV